MADASNIPAGPRKGAPWPRTAPSFPKPISDPRRGTVEPGRTLQVERRPDPTPQPSARAIITDFLREFGLDGLGERVWQWFLQGVPMEQIMLELRNTPEYQGRFPGIRALQQKGRAISEREYIELERGYSQVNRTFGLTGTPYDTREHFGKLIAGESSPGEYGRRVEAYASAAMEFASHPANASTFGELRRLYGLTPGEELAFFIDPTVGEQLIKTRVTAAEIGVQSRRSGFGVLARGEVERLASVGVDRERAAQGFGALSDARELFSPLDMGEDVIGRGEQLAGVFEGEGAARRRIERRAERRKAAFEGGGGFAGSQEGITGLGRAY